MQDRPLSKENRCLDYGYTKSVSLLHIGECIYISDADRPPQFQNRALYSTTLHIYIYIYIYIYREREREREGGREIVPCHLSIDALNNATQNKYICPPKVNQA